MQVPLRGLPLEIVALAVEGRIMRESYSPCPNCDGGNVFVTEKDVSAGGGHAPNFLPGLGSFFAAERLNVVVCSDCGLMRFFASRTAREKLKESEKWKRVL